MDKAQLSKIREAGLEQKAIAALLKASNAMLAAAKLGNDARSGGGLEALSAMAKTLEGGGPECTGMAADLRRLASLNALKRNDDDGRLRLIVFCLERIGPRALPALEELLSDGSQDQSVHEAATKARVAIRRAMKQANDGR